MRIYLDNCCYNRPYDDQSQLSVNMEALAKLEIQEQIREGHLELASSYILEAELALNPFEAKKKDIQAFIDKYTRIYVSDRTDREIRKQALSIMENGVKLMDACHVACALRAECDVFLTTDKRLLKYQRNDIHIMNPVAYILEMEEQAHESKHD